MPVDTFERLREEAYSLSKRCYNLRYYLDSEDFNKLDSMSKDLLRRQYYYMNHYLNILHARIEHELEGSDKT